MLGKVGKVATKVKEAEEPTPVASAKDIDMDKALTRAEAKLSTANPLDSFAGESEAGKPKDNDALIEDVQIQDINDLNLNEPNVQPQDENLSDLVDVDEKQLIAEAEQEAAEMNAKVLAQEALE